jgi:hypothetical protein
MLRRRTAAASACMTIALGLALALPLAPAHAQNGGDYLTGRGMLPLKTPSVSKGGPALGTPTALPGTHVDQNRVTPSDKPVAEMSPNDALFDAINRGDIADARDAINRGADLEARNILGLMPIDLAVDLSRNDITMLLLSLRDTTPTARTGKPSAKIAAAESKPAKPAPAAPARMPSPRMAAGKPAAAESPVRRQLVSTDPGTPAPQVGFLGFGGAPRP